MTEVTRGEFDMLTRIVTQNERRIDTIDTAGTRGVGVLQVQITDLAKDFAAHEKLHEVDAARRSSGRRWAWSFAAAGAASMATVITLLVDIAQHVR